MSIAHQYTADGYYSGSVEDYGFLPNNATYTKPLAEKDGFVQKWNGKEWEYVESHKGESGYLDGKPFEMKQYGPLPDGFTETPPPPTDAELAEQVRAERDGKLAASDKYLVADFPISAEKLEQVKAYRKALRDVPSQDGFPHDVKWPENPMESN